MLRKISISAVLMALSFSFPAQLVHAESWAQVGDRGLRSDIEILAARGLITGLVTTWPIPAGQLRELYDESRMEQEPEYVTSAAHRVLAYLSGPNEPGDVTGVIETRVTNSPAIVRDFGALARNQADIRVGADWNNDDFGASLRIGGQSRLNGNEGKVSLDGSSVSGIWNNVRFYGGWVDQWYGPGWDSSLILSNNARPFPKIGLMRENPTAFETPWLSWLGPWQTNFFVGLLDGPRRDTNTYMGGFRLALAPIHGLEIALSRLTEFCGQGHPCNPLSAAFNLSNSESSQNKTNDEATIELKGTTNIGAWVFSPYAQLMNEDTGPLTHSDTSYLFGSSIVRPVGIDGAYWRVTTEYSDTVATLDAFRFGTVVHGVAYNNAGYLDGFRYRDRTIGFSLDSDSRLFTFSGQLTDAQGWIYRMVYRHADISTPELSVQQYAGSANINSVSLDPITINFGELGLSIPSRWCTIDLAVRGQDALTTPVVGVIGDRFAVELGVVYKF